MLLFVPFILKKVLASSALSHCYIFSSFINCVFVVVFMISRTVRFAFVGGSNGFAAKNILFWRDLLEMLRTNAKGISTQMIYLHSALKWADKCGIRKSVRIHSCAPWLSHTIDSIGNFCIFFVSVSSGSCPNPTIIDYGYMFKKKSRVIVNALFHHVCLQLRRFGCKTK